MIRSPFVIILILAGLMLRASAEIYQIDCEIDSGKASIILATKDPADDWKTREGISFYAHNSRKDHYFAVLESSAADLTEPLKAEPLRSKLQLALQLGNLRLKGIDRLTIPPSHLLLVGNVEKYQLLKIPENEGIQGIKRQVDELTPVGNSLIFRKDRFAPGGFTAAHRGLLSGDVLIVPFRSYAATGENCHYPQPGAP